MLKDPWLLYPDAHAHIIEYGAKKQLELDGAQSVAEVIARVRAYILARPDVLYNTSVWIEGMGWDQTRWSPAEFPTAVCLFLHFPLRFPEVEQ